MAIRWKKRLKAGTFGLALKCPAFTPIDRAHPLIIVKAHPNGNLACAWMSHSVDPDHRTGTVPITSQEFGSLYGAGSPIVSEHSHLIVYGRGSCLMLPGTASSENELFIGRMHIPLKQRGQMDQDDLKKLQHRVDEVVRRMR